MLWSSTISKLINSLLHLSGGIDAAIFNKTNVAVWQDGRILDYGREIEKQTEHSITINGVKYLKATCEFRVR
jgi:hypothetical protein